MTQFTLGSTSDVEAAAHGREVGVRARVGTRRSSAQRDGSPLAAALNGRPASAALAQMQRRADGSAGVARAVGLASRLAEARRPASAGSAAPVQAKGITSYDTGNALEWAEIALLSSNLLPELAPINQLLMRTLTPLQWEQLHADIERTRRIESTDLDDDDQELIEDLHAPIDEHGIAELIDEGLAEQVDALNTQLLATDDVAAVTAALAPFIPGLDQAAVARLKTYLFDNKGISANAANYLGWRRVATGRGTVDDARFLTHEFHEYGWVAAAAEEAGLPVTFARDQEEGFEAWNEQADTFYDEFHPQAFVPEYEFLTDTLRGLTDGQLNLAPEELAAADPTRPEARRQLIPGADADAPPSAAWLRGLHAEAASRAVEIDAPARGHLGLAADGPLTLGEVVRALKQVRLARAQAILQATAPPGGGPRVVQRVADHDLTEWQEQLLTRPELAHFDPDFQELALALGQFDPLEPSEEELAGLHGRVAALGQAVLDRDDVDAVRESLGRTLGTNVTREDVAALKRYEFDSDSNVLTAENLVAWRRLAAGTPTRDDLRFFVQQWHELQALRESNVSFDPTTHHGQAPSFGRWYVPAHQAGLVAEMRFLAANLGAQLGRPVTWEQVARSDRERREEFLPALARARGADLPAPEQALPDLDALDAQFEDDYDDELRDALRGWKRQPAGRARQRTQVFTYLHGLQSSPRGADYWRDVGFERVETQVGPVWADPRNADAAREALGAFDADAPTHTTWLADMAEARAVAVPVVLPSREQIIALHDQLPALVAGFNYDNIDGALSIAARQPDLAGKAAALVHALVHGHTFNDANKRTGNAVLDWIVAHNRGGTGLLDSARGLLGRATAIASTAESVGQELRDLVPHAGLGEGA